MQFTRSTLIANDVGVSNFSSSAFILLIGQLVRADASLPPQPIFASPPGSSNPGMVAEYTPNGAGFRLCPGVGDCTDNGILFSLDSSLVGQDVMLGINIDHAHNQATVYLNGLQRASTSALLDLAGTWFDCIGYDCSASPTVFGLDILRQMIVSDVLSSGDISAVSTYYSNKWNILLDSESAVSCGPPCLLESTLLWVDASSPLTLNVNGSTVIDWQNLVGPGGFSSNATTPPALDSLDGFPGVDFSGDAYLLLSPTSVPAFGPTQLIMWVGKTAAYNASALDTTLSCLFSGVVPADPSGGPVLGELSFAGVATQLFLWGTSGLEGGAFETTSGDAPSDTRMILAVNRYDNGTIEFWANGLLVSTGNATAPLAGGYLQALGALYSNSSGTPTASNFCGCTLHELLVGAAVDNVTLAALFDYESIKWNIPLGCPLGFGGPSCLVPDALWWVDAGAAVTIAVDGNATVLSWANLAGPGAFSSTNTTPPVIDAMDGYPGVDFANSAYLISPPSAPASPAFGPTQLILSVLSLSSASVNGSLACFLAGTVPGSAGATAALTEQATVFAAAHAQLFTWAVSAAPGEAATTAVVDDALAPADVRAIFAVNRVDGGVATFWINNVLVATANATQPLAGGFLQSLGALLVNGSVPSAFCNCTVHEVVVGSAVSNGTLASLFYLESVKWAIALGCPLGTGGPYCLLSDPLWSLDASDNATVTLGPDSAVLSWMNKAGPGAFSALNATPTLDATGGGSPAVDFANATYLVSLPSAPAAPAFGPTQLIVVVATLPTNTTPVSDVSLPACMLSGVLGDAPLSLSQSFFSGDYAGPLQLATWWGSATEIDTVVVDGDGLAPPGTDVIFAVNRVDGQFSGFSMNGALVSSATTTLSLEGGFLTALGALDTGAGPSDFCNCSLKELLVGSAVNNATLTAIFNYLSDKWGIPLAGPFGANTIVCASAADGDNATLACPPGTVVLGIDSASYGTAYGYCPTFTPSDCYAATSLAVVAAACVGQSNCSVFADPSTFGGDDPCVMVPKTLNFVASCGPPSWCASVAQNSVASLACPLGTVITSVDFASYGNATGVCGDFVASACDVDGAATIVSAACVGQRSCVVNASDAVLLGGSGGGDGDACANAVMSLAVAVNCGAPTFACSSADGGGNVTLTCPLQGSNITTVDFASCGALSGICPDFSAGLTSGDATLAVSDPCSGASSCSFPVIIGDSPCGCGVATDYLDVAVGCSEPVLLCASASPGNDAKLTCDVGYAISAINSAEYGDPSGSCDGGGDGGGERRLHAGDDDGGGGGVTLLSCSATTSFAVVAAACIGHTSCTVTASDDTFGGNPCPGQTLLITATCALVSPPVEVCASAPQGATATLACPLGYALGAINFASFGTPDGPCPYFHTGACHAASSVDFVSATCLGMQSCSVLADSDAFGDPDCVGDADPDTVQLVIAATCVV